MSTISCFLTDEDFVRLVVVFCEAHEFHVRVNSKDGTLIFRADEIDRQAVRQAKDPIYLFRKVDQQHVNGPPFSSYGAIQPRAWGWVEIDKGGEVLSDERKLILMTVIYATDRKGYRPASWLRSLLKRDIQVACGVVGANVVYGGESVYREICYSPLALERYQQGYLWKQFTEDNAVFRPVEPF